MANPSASKDALIGKLVGGRYEVIRVIGKGGTGSIYEVRNIRLGHSFALKTLAGDAATNAEAIQRFRREADIVARIKHPNIVEVIDWDELPDGSPCIIMEYLRGGDLATRIEQLGPLPWPVIAVIADQVLAALTTTHASGVVHRDLKPANVFLAADDSGDERVKLLDFGVSKIRDSTSLQTMNDRLVGTPSYMAPEQAEGRSDEIGPHTDVWAMAIILHEMATGVRAFEGPSLPAILYAVCHGEPASITTHRPDAPAAFVQLIADALVRPISERIADVATMRARLREALRDVAGVDYSKMPSMPRAPSVPPKQRMRSQEALADTLGNEAVKPASIEASPAPRATSRRPLFAALGALAVGGAVTAVVLATRSESKPTVPPTDPVVAVIVTHDAATAHEPAVVADAAAEPATTAPVDAAVHTTRPTRPHAATRDEFVSLVRSAVERKMASLGRCVEQHPDTGVKEVTATITIGRDGRATNVAIAPADVAASTLAACLKSGLLTVSYPTSNTGGTVAFPLALTSR